MSLKDLLKPNKDGDPKIVAAIEQKVSDAQELIITTQKEFNKAALAAEDRGSDAATKRADAARKSLMDAQDRLQRLTCALLEARQRQQDAQKSEAEADTTKAWSVTARLAKSRYNTAIELQVMADNIASKYLELLDINTKQLAACPNSLGAKGGFAVPELLGAFRLYFVKQDMGWAQPDWPWGPDRIKPLAHIIEESNAVMMANKDKDKDRAA